MRSISLPRTLVALLAFATTNSVWAGDSNWPQFRGPGALGVGDGTRFPETWSTTENVAWKSDVPGAGWSSPIVWGNRIFVTTVTRESEGEPVRKGLYFGGERPTPPADKHHWKVLCFDFDSGKQLWERELHSGAPAGPVHLKNNYAAETPVTDGERVYAYFGNHGLFSLDFSGKVLWSKSWGAFKIRNAWGTAASPVLHGDRVYVVNDNEEQSFIVALDKRTGDQVWRTDRDEKSNWATPCVWQHEQRTEIITSGRQKVRSYGLDGKLLWEFGGMSSIVIPTPFSKHGLLYVCSGYVGDKTRPIFAIKPGASGDISLGEDETANQSIAWAQKTAGPYNPSPIVYGDYLYVLFDFGFLSCHDARTGKEIYPKQRLNTEGTAAFTASPWASNGKIFCLSEDGDTYVVQAGPEFKLIRKNPLAEMCMATPALARDSLVIRTAARLYRIAATKN